MVFFERYNVTGPARCKNGVMTCINWSPSWPEKISVYSGGWCQFGQKSHNSTIETKKDAVPTDETETVGAEDAVQAWEGFNMNRLYCFYLLLR